MAIKQPVYEQDTLFSESIPLTIIEQPSNNVNIKSRNLEELS